MLGILFIEHLELFIHTSRDDPQMAPHRAVALQVYQQLPSLTTAIEARPVTIEPDVPGDADVAQVVQTAMQKALAEPT